MIVGRMYLGGREVLRVYRTGKVLWPLSTEAELSVLMEIFTTGYQALTVGERVVLISCDAALPAADANAAVYPMIPLAAEGHSKTAYGGTVLPLPAIVCVCNRESLTRAELHFLVANAVSLTERTDLLSEGTAHSLAAAAVYGGRREDNGTEYEAEAFAAAAACGDHADDITTDSVATAEVPVAACGASTEDSNSRSGAAMQEPPTAVFAAAQGDSTSESLVTLLPIRVSDIVYLDTDNDSRTADTAKVAIPAPVPLSATLRLVTTCTAHMRAVPAADMRSRTDPKTRASILLQLEGEQPEEKWYEPVQTGDDLYIRSSWLFWQDGSKGHMDTDIWYEAIRSGGNLYIRSVHALWTDGGSANIDTAFFLEPVQAGSDLYIRQNIFGGE